MSLLPSSGRNLPKNYVLIRSLEHKTKPNLTRLYFSRHVKKFQCKRGRGAPSALEKKLLMQQLHKELKVAFEDEKLPPPVLVQQVATREEATEEHNGAFYQRVDIAADGKDGLSAFLQANHNFKTFLAPLDASTFLETHQAADELEQTRPDCAQKANEFKVTVCQLYGIVCVNRFFREKLEHEFVRIINKMWDELNPKVRKGGKPTSALKPALVQVDPRDNASESDDSDESSIVLKKKPKPYHSKSSVTPVPVPTKSTETCSESRKNSRRSGLFPMTSPRWRRIF